MKKYYTLLICLLSVFISANTEVYAGYIEKIQIGGENEWSSIEYFNENYDNDGNDKTDNDTDNRIKLKYEYFVPIYSPYYGIHYFPPGSYRPYYPPMPPNLGMFPPPPPPPKPFPPNNNLIPPPKFSPNGGSNNTFTPVKPPIRPLPHNSYHGRQPSTLL